MAINGPSANTVANSVAGPPSVGTADPLGLQQDPELDDLKQAAVSVFQQGQARAKHPKLTHNLFFDDGKGLSKIVQSFPRIRFQGKGQEFNDLKLLIRHYEKWFKELLPCDDHFEDLVWKARTVLQEKERHDDGGVSDPREQLHHLRLRYKTSSGLGTRGEQEKRADLRADLENRQSSNISSELRKRLEEKRGLDMETLSRIEEKRAKALELKRKRQEEAAARDGGAGGAGGRAASSQTQSSRVSQEDVFGFGGGLDGSQSSAMAGRDVARAFSQTQSNVSQEDVFGFGGRFDGSQASSAAARHGAASHQALSQASEHDVFGFGVELDGSQASSSAQPLRVTTSAACAAPSTVSHGPQATRSAAGAGRDSMTMHRAMEGHAALSEELRNKIESNRQRALQVQRRRQSEEAADKDGADAPKDIDLETLWKIEENRAKALELRRKRRMQAAARASSGPPQAEGGSQTPVETRATQLTQLERARGASQSQRESMTAASQADEQVEGCKEPPPRCSLASPRDGGSQQGPFGSGCGTDTSQEVAPRAAAPRPPHGGAAPQCSLDEPDRDNALASSAHHPLSLLVGMSQPDAFEFGCGLDGSEQPSPAEGVGAMSGQAASIPRRTETRVPMPPELLLAAGDTLAASQLDVFGFGFDLDATQQAPHGTLG
mmetsp:Transcript_73097/g.169478  ORF Transcript_73097/g.169478 Transcript_73097/m.169478 type:complete len:663 (-) Transcript_73097:263-2251(-)|eukprot:CAMPEP_0171076050 /NCGR_PEP_ID=MMETSP0766_2-20121228/13168_1 /TAXON_ID=439317 /ORGANISM="Gambierdiscus australes, Strain CAWD 149" /LENGTH=662 /DNA_ID=CAMNT_0011532977 /DNA_START=60 /DNA_END=2048 /DNA_ORIENTATION=+